MLNALKRISPINLIALGAILLTILVWLALLISLNVPWLGLSLGADGDRVTITDIAPQSPLLGTITAPAALQQINGMTLIAEDLLQEPDEISTVTDYLAFFTRNADLYHSLQLTSTLNIDNQAYIVKPLAQRPLSSLPLVFWYQIVCGVFIGIISVAVLAFNRGKDNIAPVIYSCAGFAITIAVLCSAVYSSRELVIADGIFYFLNRLNLLAGISFCGFGTALFWYFPKPLSSFPMIKATVAAIIIFYSMNLLAIIESLDISIRALFVSWFAICMLVSLLQWLHSKNNPIDRAGFKWVMFSWLAGTGAFIALVYVPMLFFKEAVVHQTWGFGALSLAYAGVSIGIIRYQLFNIDRWVSLVCFWVFCGFSLILIDLLLIYLLDFDGVNSLLISLLLVSFIYFPLRQKLLEKIMPLSEQRQFLATFQQLFNHKISPASSTREQWLTAMNALFQPQQVTATNTTVEQARFEQHGLKMRLPGFNDIPSYTLAYANNGRRLFNHHDAQLANTSALFFQHLALSKQAFQEGMVTERQRLARDLHDDIGAKLLSLIYNSSDEKSADSARAVLHELRSVIQGLQTDTISSEQFAAQLSTETSQRCNEADIKLSWQQQLSDFDISSRYWRNLRTACREIISNMLKHSHCTVITVDLKISQQQLVINLSDNGIGFDTEQPAKGNGLYNIAQRIDEINGQLTVQSTTATVVSEHSGSHFSITLNQGV
ncbi:hypothetical protein SIN8267_01075 [Sinobacterium norvegicum]|uniref:Histidine kinase/HSP90-like ATPase domain-containing protein n=1 Tax=Sinobacterium norvegicum TaxID=1641715 RepID=A0ABM9AD92_9GAMM|nr:ATP-binding protein [Sinobacterium norvegicum]CAH0990974.1 hypothetical protein SIN8267_01075 [Sinobacterium norvegicum]